MSKKGGQPRFHDNSRGLRLIRGIEANDAINIGANGGPVVRQVDFARSQEQLAELGSAIAGLWLRTEIVVPPLEKTDTNAAPRYQLHSIAVADSLSDDAGRYAITQVAGAQGRPLPLLTRGNRGSSADRAFVSPGRAPALSAILEHGLADQDDFDALHRSAAGLIGIARAGVFLKHRDTSIRLGEFLELTTMAGQENIARHLIDQMPTVVVPAKSQTYVVKATGPEAQLMQANWGEPAVTLSIESWEPPAISDLMRDTRDAETSLRRIQEVEGDLATEAERMSRLGIVPTEFLVDFLQPPASQSLGLGHNL